MLAHFRAGDNDRLVLATDCPDGTVLVLDCRDRRLSDARVVARIAPEEPPANAQLIARIYATDERRGRPRALLPADLAPANPPERPTCLPDSAALTDGEGNSYAIACLEEGACKLLRWTRATRADQVSPDPVSLRSVIGALERYEPPMTLTEAALAGPPTDASTRILHVELERLRRSQIVLNRGLREAVAKRVAEGTTLSEIALRCGRLKHPRRGQPTGETSWLARRIGALPEGGQARPTPWIHSDTLALIARDGLSISPREVEL